MLFRFFIIIIAFSLQCAVPAFSEVRATMVMGRVSTQSRDSEEIKPLVQDYEVFPGDTVMTGEDSYAELVSGGTVIKVNEESRIRISRSMVDEKEGDSLSMFFGSVMLKIKKLTRDEAPFVVETPSALCAVRGTEFTVASGHDGQTIVQVEEGSVSLTGNEKEVLIGKDQESSVLLGGEPAGVTRLKKRAWVQWLRENREGMKGKEIRVLRGALMRMKKLGRDIEVLEGLNEKFTQQKETFEQQAKVHLQAGDRAKHREFSVKAHRAKRKAYIALNAAFYKAEKLDLVRVLARNAFESLKEKTGEAGEARDRIEAIFNRNNERYIRKIRSRDDIREKIRERRRGN